MEGRAGRKLESCCCSQSLAEAEAARGCPCCPSRHAGSPWGRDSHLGMLQGQSAERHAWLKSCRSGKGGADAGLERPWGGLGAAEQGTGLARQIYGPEPSDPVAAVCHGVCERVPVRGGTVTPTQPGEASCGRVGWVGPTAEGSGAPKRVHGVEEGRALQSRDGGAPPGSVGRSSSLLSTAQPCSAPETRQRISPWLFQLETRVESSSLLQQPLGSVFKLENSAATQELAGRHHVPLQATSWAELGSCVPLGSTQGSNQPLYHCLRLFRSPGVDLGAAGSCPREGEGECSKCEATG